MFVPFCLDFLSFAQTIPWSWILVIILVLFIARSGKKLSRALNNFFPFRFCTRTFQQPLPTSFGTHLDWKLGLCLLIPNVASTLCLTLIRLLKKDLALPGFHIQENPEQPNSLSTWMFLSTLETRENTFIQAFGTSNPVLPTLADSVFPAFHAGLVEESCREILGCAMCLSRAL